MSTPSVTIPPTMRAARLEQFDCPAPGITTVAVPEIGAEDVLVRVVAVGMNPIDDKIRAGLAPYAEPELPATMGTDVAGVVAAVGSAVEGFDLGQRVFGLVGGVRGVPGALAEYVRVDARLLAPVPHSLDLRSAAALPLVSLSAWEGLVDGAHVRPHDRVLVIGGSGGVGHLAVQIAAAHGAEVFATASTGKQELLRSLGAIPIDYTRESVAEYVDRYTGGRGFDIVFDTVGGASLDEAIEAAAPRGRVVSCAAFGPTDLAAASFRAVSVHPVYVLLPLLSGDGRAHHGAILRAVADLVGSAGLRPIVDPRRFSLYDLATAYAAVGSGSARVKIVVDVDD